MKAGDIVKHLWEWLPKFTDKFTVTYNAVSSVAVVGEDVTITFGSPHSFVVGQQIVVNQALVLNEIDTVQLGPGVDEITLTTVNPHDLTENWSNTVTFTGSTNAALNGTFELLRAPNRQTLVCRTTNTDITNPGTYYLNELLECGGIQGVYQVASVPDVNSVVINVPGVTATDYNVDDMEISDAPRIARDAEIERVIDSYTRQPSVDDFWAFVILDDNTTSKDRAVETDATHNVGGQNGVNLQLMVRFSVYVFVKTTGKISAGEARDLCEELRPALYKALVGDDFTSGFGGDNQTSVGPLTDGIFEYTKAYYIHRYQFEKVDGLTTSDIIYKTPTRAFRDIDLNIAQPFNLDAGATDDLFEIDVDLDDQPLN